MAKNVIKVLVVDDSQVSRDLLVHLLTIDEHIQVTGTASNGFEALEMLKKDPPDLVVTDIVMPGMNGYELTKKIMETQPIPIIVVSGVYSREEIQKSFQAMDAGALAILEKPRGLTDVLFAEATRFIIEGAKTMTEIHSLLTKSQSKAAPSYSHHIEFLIKILSNKQKKSGPIKAVGIGSSIGGPKALRAILAHLQDNIKAPIFIVQHISPGFVQGFIEWLEKGSKIKIHLAQNGQPTQPGHVYIAPDKMHMEILPGGIISLVPNNPPELFLPSAGRMFKSLAQSYGSSCMGIMLMGAEKDGAKDFKTLEDKGALTIIEKNPFNQKESDKLDETGPVYATAEEIAQILKYFLKK